MTGIEIVVGYLLAWATQKARRIGGRADAEIDRALDLGMDRLHDIVSKKLPEEPALKQLEEEAAKGESHELTRLQVQQALHDAMASDQRFAAQIGELLGELQRYSAAQQGRSVEINATANDDGQMPILGQGYQQNTFGARGQ